MFDWTDYPRLAHDLGGRPGASVTIRHSEATSRSAVSRAYYPAFCHARNYARQRLGYQPRNTADDHGDLREHYEALGMTAVSRRLDRLRRWRNLCDHRDTVRGLPVIVREALQEAAAVIQAL